MTLYPPPVPHLDYSNPQHRSAHPLRPGSVTALGVIGIVLSSIVFLNHTLWLAFYAAFVFRLPGPLHSLTVYWALVEMTISLAFGAVLLTLSIGLLRLRPWARDWIRTYAVLYLLWLAFCAAVAVTLMIPASVARMRSADTPREARGSSIVVVVYVGGLAFTAVAAIFPIFVLAVTNRPHVRAAFGAPAGDGRGQDTTVPPGDYPQARYSHATYPKGGTGAGVVPPPE